ASTVSLLLGPISAASAAYTYSAKLVNPYVSGCSQKLTAKGMSVAQADKMCRCSIQQMQAEKSQNQAIAMLMVARFSSSIDPSTGMPTSLSKYFSTCRA
ncbi:MAG TPA: hypothetical protein V6D19_15340, partial [Stenomitos sp.]